MEQQIVVDGLTITVIRKKIKNMYLRVYPPNGEVKITVPRSMDEKTIKTFVLSHIDWIIKQKAKQSDGVAQQEHQYQTGEIHSVWGKGYELVLLEGEVNRKVLLTDDKILLYMHKNSTREEREEVLDQWYRKQLEQAMEESVVNCVKLVGRSPKEWRIRKMKTRWGTCNVVDKRIWLNLQLAKKSPECLNYVIIHELVHLYVRNHGPEFKAYMDYFCPNWRELKKRLNVKSFS